MQTRRLLLTFVLSPIVVVLGALAAWAFWTSTGTGTASASTGTLNASTAVTASNTAGTSTVAVSWTNSTSAAGISPTGYFVTRVTNAGGATANACGSSRTSATALNPCNDTSVPDGTYHYVVTAVKASWTAASSSSNNVKVSSPSKLAFTTAPSTSAISGTALATQPVVTVQDAAGNTMTRDTSSVTLTLTNRAGATLACSANTTGAVSGVASFAGCQIDKAGIYTLTAADGSLTSAISGNVTITPGAAAKFTFVSTPVSGTTSSAATLGPITVEEQDAFGNAVTATGVGMPVALSSSSSGAKTFASSSGGTPVTSVTIGPGASSATFYYGDTKAGSPVITASADTLTSATQIETIRAAAASKLAFGQSPTNAVAGVSSAPAPTVQVLDAFGNLTSSTATVTVAIGTNPSSGTLSGAKTLAAVSGVATFPGLSLDMAGTGYTAVTSSPGLTGATSSTFNITAGAASVLTKSAGDAQSARVNTGFGTALAARVTDSFGNVVPGVSVTFTAAASGASGTFANSTMTTSASTNAGGIATASAFTANTTAGSYAVSAAATGATSASFTATNTAGAASKFVITSAAVSGPASATANLGPITVQEQDQFGNAVTATGTGTTVNLASSSAGSKLFATGYGGTSVTSVVIPVGQSSGTFFYGDKLAGTPQITVSGGLASDAQIETITVAGASKFVIASAAVSGPASATANLGPITVQEQDQFGNAVNAPSGGTAVNLASNSAGTKLFDTTANGTTSVTSVTIPVGTSSTTFFYGDNKAGTPQITVSGGLASDVQVETITVGAATQFGITSSPFKGTASSSANLGPLTVQEQDSFGNPVIASSDVAVTLSSSSSGATFATGSGGTAVTTVTIAALTSSANFFYGDTLAGNPAITASGLLDSDIQTGTIITAAAANKLGFTSPPVTGTRSSAANLGPIAVQLLDSFGNPTNAPAGGTTVTLSSTTPNGGAKIFATTLGSSTSVPSVTIPEGASSVTFYYGATASGSPVITATSGSLTPASQTETITATALFFTTGAVSGNASATANLGPITVQERDGGGNPVLSPMGGTTVNLASNSAGAKLFATTLNGTASVSSVVIPPNQSSVTFYYGDNKAGTPLITASASSTIATATQTETIVAGAATKLAFTSNPVSGNKSSTANLGPIRVQEQDFFSNPAAAPSGGTVVSLSSSSTGTKIFAATRKGTSVPSVTIPAGTSSTTFYYGDGKKGSPVITVSSTGLTQATQIETIIATPATQFAITSAAVPATAASSATLAITVERRDSFGDPVAATNGNQSVTLSSSSSGGRFAASSGSAGTAVTSFTFGQGNTSVTFYYGDTKAGSPVITASGSLTSATQTETITAAAAAKLAFTSPPLTGVKSTTPGLGPITVQVQDSFGNAVKATGSGTTVGLTSTTPNGGTASFSLALNGASVTVVTIPAGSSSIPFYYGCTASGSPVITVSSTPLTLATQTETITN
ncbi:MAG: beta strand repeat-containing protein [Propionicimonas sp.]